MYLHSSATLSRIIPIIRFRLAVACAWTAFSILIASWEYWDYLKFKSVAISTAVLEHAMHHSNINHLSIIVVIWLLGLWFLWSGFRRINRATAALMTERDNLSAVFDATPMPMLLFDDRMEAVRVNGAFRAYCSDYDTLPDKRCGTILKCANALSTPQGCGHSAACDSGLLMQALREVLKSGLSVHGEVTIPRAGQDGSAMGLLLLYGVEPVSLDGKIHALLSFLDISERKLMEKKLAASEHEFRALAETMPDNIARYDCNCRILYINPALERTLGISLDAVKGKRPLEIFPAGQYIDYQAALDNVLATGVDAEMEMPMPDGAGGIVYYQIRMVVERDQEGAMCGALAIGRNITELKQLEREQANRERELRTLVENTPDSIARYDQFCRRIYVNPAMELLSGRPASYLIGRTPFEAFVVTPEVGRKVQDAVEQVLDQAEPIEIELIWKDSGGLNRYSLSRYVPEFDANGEVTSVLSITRDITTLRSTEAQLQHAQKLESIGFLAGGVAHDFNNILAVIGGYAELLKLTISGNEVRHAYLQEIIDGVNRGTELTRSLLLFSGKHEPNKQYDSLNLIVANLEKSMLRLISSDITLSFGICNDQLPVLADRGQIEQVVINLMVNARDALVSGGQIRVETALADIREAITTGSTTLPPGRYGLITVADNGIGMDRETAARIFDPFFTTKESGKGTGLGLAIVSGIVAQHGGHIAVESAPGDGTFFKVYLPVCEGHLVREQAKDQEHAVLCGNETVLVADDDPNLLLMTANMLARYGYTVLTAADGVEALHIYESRRNEIQAVIIDLIMPRMNGWETVARMRQQRPALPVILTSGYSDVVFDEPDLRFLPKPVCIKKLTETLRSALDSSENSLQKVCACIRQEMTQDSDGWL